MSARELMAWLNAKTVNFDTGRGGIPNMTPQDIAAALAMVDGLAREVYCHVWWPDGAKLTAKALDRYIAQGQALQYNLRKREWHEAHREFHGAQIRLDGDRSRAAMSELSQLRGRVDSLRRDCWPDYGAIYGTIRNAALFELATPNLCPECAGRGEVGKGDLRATCARCTGNGRVSVSDHKRADMIGRDPKTYRETWRPVYEWTFGLLSDAEAQADAVMSKWLRRAG